MPAEFKVSNVAEESNSHAVQFFQGGPCREAEVRSDFFGSAVENLVTQRPWRASADASEVGLKIGTRGRVRA